MIKKKTSKKTESEQPISPSDALFGFVDWLTSQKTPITASKRHDSKLWYKKVNEFCEANNLPLSDNKNHKIKIPGE